MPTLNIDTSKQLVFHCITSPSSDLYKYISEARFMLDLKLYAKAQRYITNALNLYPYDFQLTYLLIQSYCLAELGFPRREEYFSYLYEQLTVYNPKQSIIKFDDIICETGLATIYLEQSKILLAKLETLVENNQAIDYPHNDNDLPSSLYCTVADEALYCVFIYSKTAYSDPEGYFIKGELENYLGHIYWTCKRFETAVNYFVLSISSYSKAIKLSLAFNSNTTNYRNRRLDSINAVSNIESIELDCVEKIKDKVGS